MKVHKMLYMHTVGNDIYYFLFFVVGSFPSGLVGGYGKEEVLGVIPNSVKCLSPKQLSRTCNVHFLELFQRSCSLYNYIFCVPFSESLMFLCAWNVGGFIPMCVEGCHDLNSQSLTCNQCFLLHMKSRLLFIQSHMKKQNYLSMHGSFGSHETLID